MADARQLTKIEKKHMQMRRKDWQFFVAETDRAIGLDLHEYEPGKSGNIRMPMEAWLFLLSVIEAALTCSGYTARQRGGGGGDCDCDTICRGFGGCDFSYGVVYVCGEGDLFICPPEV